ncbi:hypothetical protein E2C01_076563 [Portunus trituberculatus]|uniref:Uncharacterized protein n=1 Tax=Portunus trituberculatus TaxID=210409 RepID=A0A5B7IDI7_PORTR|nr:hypothetical protein [Portunus trituberculatus]
MTVAVAGETLKRMGNKTLHPKIDRTDINTVREGGTIKAEVRPSEELPEQETAEGGPCGGNPPSYSDLKMTSRGPGARKTTYWDYNGSERWLPWTGYLVFMWTSRFKKRPHMIRIFVQDRAEIPLPKHPSLDTEPYSTGRPPAGGSTGPLAAYVGTI